MKQHICPVITSTSVHEENFFLKDTCCDFKMKNWELGMRGSIFTDFAISEILNVKNGLVSPAKQTINKNRCVTF